MNIFIIPANSKAGKLIFSLFTPFDLILLVSGILFSVVSLLVVAPKTFAGFMIGLIPAIVCIALVVPVPHYHNIFTVLRETIEFFYNRRNYKWEGWCVKDEYKD